VLRRLLEPKQYTSAAFADLASEFAVTLSHGRTGRCWDNALSESFFASLKGELIDLQTWPTRAMAPRAVVEYIGWYNGTRLHSTLGYRSPAEIRGTEQDHECSLTKSSALSVKAGQPQMGGHVLLPAH
jgi:transposase InsO family protein